MISNINQFTFNLFLTKINYIKINSIYRRTKHILKKNQFSFKLISVTIAKVKAFMVMKSEDWVWGITEFEGVWWKKFSMETGGSYFPWKWLLAILNGAFWTERFWWKWFCLFFFLVGRFCLLLPNKCEIVIKILE